MTCLYCYSMIITKNELRQVVFWDFYIKIWDIIGQSLVIRQELSLHNKQTLLSRLFLLLLTGLLLALPAAAQEPDEHPLLRMLALVPDVPEVRETLVGYADYRAMESVRGIDMPTAQDFFDRTELSAQWIATSIGMSTGMRMEFFLLYLEDMPRLVGFGFFDIDQTLVFGEPPSMGMVLEGDFPPERIAAAHSARGFVEHEIGGVTVWCSPDGCDDGLRQNIKEREPGNPFGGSLGRREPLAVFSDSLLGNSASDSVVEAMIAAQQGEQRSLAESLDYGAIAEAISSGGTLVQIQFVSPLQLGLDPAMLMMEDTSSIREIVSEYGDLPPYALAAFADVGVEGEQVALIALAYADAELAQAAAEELAARLVTFESLRTGQPLVNYFEDLDAVIGEPYVYESETNGWAVALLPVHYPIPSNEPSEDSPRYTASGLVYRQLISELYSRGLYFLGTDFSALEE